MALFLELVFIWPVLFIAVPIIWALCPLSYGCRNSRETESKMGFTCGNAWNAQWNWNVCVCVFFFSWAGLCFQRAFFFLLCLIELIRGVQRARGGYRFGMLGEWRVFEEWSEKQQAGRFLRAVSAHDCKQEILQDCSTGQFISWNDLFPPGTLNCYLPYYCYRRLFSICIYW